MYGLRSDEFKNCYKEMDVIRSLFYRYIACNFHRVAHDNGGWRRLSITVATERCWVEGLNCKGPELKKYCKPQKIKYMLNENVISSWNIALTGASFQSLSE